MTKILSVLIVCCVIAAFSWFDRKSNNAESLCANSQTVFEVLTDSGETPVAVFQGEVPELAYILFVNNQTQAWTFVSVINKTNTACVVSTGPAMSVISRKSSGKEQEI